MYSVKMFTDNNAWEQFVLSQPYTLFVQSPSYGKFYEAMGEKYWIFGVYENEKLVGGSLVVSTHAKRGDFLYLPYGPLLDYTDETMMRTFVEYLQKFARENKYDFIRITPFIEDTPENRGVIQNVGFRPAPMHMLAENTWLLDMSESDETLSQKMGKNHRNLIHRCEREGVRVEKSSAPDALAAFHDLHDKTAERHKFRRFSREYIEKEFKYFAEHNQSLIFRAYLPDGRLDSSAIIMYYGNMAAYRHAASLNLDKRLPTSYLLQWEAIREAKRRGMKWYNFWGVAPEGTSKKHPFWGITHFKKGFGGFEKALLRCHDLPVSKKYWLNWIVETCRRKRRGF